MGILGLDTAFLLSERVFQIMDEDQDGEVIKKRKPKPFFLISIKKYR